MANPLTLFNAWRDGQTDGFKRPAPPAQPPLPLTFRCGECGKTVRPTWTRCPYCGEPFHMPNGNEHD